MNVKPGYAEAYLNLSAIVRDSGKLAEANNACRCALALAPANAEAHINLGAILSDLGDPIKAEISCRRAMALGQESASVHYLLANILMDLGNRNLAAEHFRRCITIDADDAVGARNMLASMGLEPVPIHASVAHLDRLYSKRSQTWDLGTGFFGHLLVAEALGTMMRGVKEKIAILDAGCGTGLVGCLVRDMALTLDGVDLSTAMLDKAKEKGIYDHLYHSDLVDFLLSNPRRYRAITCSATLIHFGDLVPVFAAVEAALSDEGLFVFTLFPDDADFDGENYIVARNRDLANGGCYAHGRRYIERVAAQTGFLVEMYDYGLHEYGKEGAPVTGAIIALRRSRRTKSQEVDSGGN